MVRYPGDGVAALDEGAALVVAEVVGALNVDGAGSNDADVGAGSVDFEIVSGAPDEQADPAKSRVKIAAAERAIGRLD